MPGSFILQQVLEDPMLSNFEMGLRRLYYPLGFPLEIQTNSRQVIEAASEAWGLFSQSFDIAPLRLALGVKEGVAPDPLPTKSTFLTRDHLLAIIANADNFVMCDFNAAFSFGWITPELASDSATLRYRILTPAAVMMAEHLALAPLHGAFVTRNDCGVLLCGESFAGKSTLAYACARSGWTYITDDGTFLVRDRSDRYAVGNSHFIRFREDARQLFPELSKWLVVTRPNGKIGMEVPTRDLEIAIAPGATIDHVVFLDRNHAGPARLRRCAKDQLQAWCDRHVNFGSKEVRSAQTRTHARLLDAPIWEMSYQNFDDAVRRLEQLVGSGG
jgi:hypothetical protein